MALNPDGSLFVDTALWMSRLSDNERTSADAEVTRLVRLTLGGDSDAFEQIIERYEGRVMGLAARLLGTRDDAQDATQEVFLRAFKYLHRLDLRKPLEPWLMRIAVNVCRDTVRARQRRRDTFSDVEQPEAIDHTADTYTGFAKKQERLVWRQALDGLPEKERLAIVLRDIEGFTTAEVASILHSSETTVRSQISRGRLKLRGALARLLRAS